MGRSDWDAEISNRAECQSEHSDESRERAVRLAIAATQAGDATRTVLLSALRKLNQELSKRVGDGRKNFESMKFDRLNEFLTFDYIINVEPLFSYVQCLKAAGAKTRAELEEMWKGWYHDAEVRECVEELLSLEASIQKLFDDIDVEVQKTEDQLAFPNVTKVDEQLPADLALTNCRSGEVINLENVWSSPN